MRVDGAREASEDASMLGTISPDVVRAATGLRRSHPQAPVLDILDACFRQRAGSLAHFCPDALDPCSDFGQLLADGFDKGMAPQDWQLLLQPLAPAVRDALRRIWRATVLTQFAARYSLTP